MESKNFLKELGFPEGDLHDVPLSEKRFKDGAQFRVEIPSIESPRVLEAVLEEAEKYKVKIHRVSQGSGVMLLPEEDIREMAKMGREANMEVSLFTGPRGPWDITAHAYTDSGKNMGWRVAGMDQLVYCLEDIKRACELGIRGVLIADEGVLYLAGQMREKGELPKELVIKASALMGHPNPVAVKLCQDMGANTYNIPSDQTYPRLAAMRKLVDLVLDMYIEVPDNLGGYARYYEVPQIIKVAAPVYLKVGLINAINAYPSGTHLEREIIAASREKVRRAKIIYEMIERYYPDAICSDGSAEDLGIPV